MVARRRPPTKSQKLRPTPDIPHPVDNLADCWWDPNYPFHAGRFENFWCYRVPAPFLDYFAGFNGRIGKFTENPVTSGDKSARSEPRWFASVAYVWLRNSETNLYERYAVRDIVAYTFHGYLLGRRIGWRNPRLPFPARNRPTNLYCPELE